MQALVSGQAGLFATQTATGFTVERIDTGQTYQAGSRDLAYYFSGCNDVATFSVRSAAEARARTELAWSADRGVRLFVILLDPQEVPEDLIEVGEAFDELLSVKGVLELVENQVFSAPLPDPIDVQAVFAALQTSPLSRSLLEDFLNHQAAIARVRGAFDQIEVATFENERSRQIFLETAIDRGSVRELVRAAGSNGKIDGALFRLYSDLREFENHREIIQLWTSSFERVHHNPKVEVEVEFEGREVYREPRVGSGGRQAFERVLQQQVAIVDRIRAADFDGARRYARELIAEQHRTSSPEHIAKSLSRICQKARQLDVIELAMEWAQQAVEAKPDDAVAHAQLADLLMRAGRYIEAHQSLDLAQSFGKPAFAASGRARIMRYQGHFADALAAYQEAVAQSTDDSDQKHFDLAGIAECLRDMEDFEGALSAYDEAITEFPFVAVLHAGRAATLVDFGRYEDALQGYREAINLDDYNVIPRTGIASLYRRAGDFERAEAEYRGIIAEYPFNIRSRGGLIKTLRELGRFSDAVGEARALVHDVPTSPDAMWNLADAQIDAGELNDAVNTLNTAIDQHRHNAGLRTGLARVEKARGHYAAALALYDAAAHDFPSNAWIQVGRADMLRRLGNIDEALRIYERAFSHHPHRLSLKNALASVYIHLRRFDEALQLLVIDNPKTAAEWRNFALRGMLDTATGYGQDAYSRYAWGIDRCPFRKERHMLRAALARLQLMNGEPQEAVETSQECADDITEIMKFHASATLEDKGPARALYDRLLRSYLPEPYHELRDEIAANYNVVLMTARRDINWLLAREEDVLLLEAA